MSLAVRSSGRGRSKSPGARDRSPARSPARPSKRYDDSSTETDSDVSYGYISDKGSRRYKDERDDYDRKKSSYDSKYKDDYKKSDYKRDDYRSSKEEFKSSKDDYRSSKYDDRSSKYEKDDRKSRHSVSEYSRRDRSLSSDRDVRRRASSPGVYKKDHDSYDKPSRYDKDDKYDRYKDDKSSRYEMPGSYKKDDGYGRYDKDDKYRSDKDDKHRRYSKDDKYRSDKEDKHSRHKSDDRHKRDRSPRRDSSPSKVTALTKHRDSSKHRYSSTETESDTSSDEEKTEKYVYSSDSKSLMGGRVQYSHEKKDKYDSKKTSHVVELRPGGGSSLLPLDTSQHRLSVGGHSLSLSTSHSHSPGGLPPGSPLLESYHGTYQSLSPMPSPIALPPSLDILEIDKFRLDGNLSDSSIDSQDSGYTRRHRHRTRDGYDIIPDTRDLVTAINAKNVKVSVLIDILPRLSHAQIIQVRAEYKKRCKIQGQGINIAKHIKSKITGSVGKAIYVTALGQWESEAYWASFWYNPNNSRRELLIEALMGRTNDDIRHIKKAFKDKRYNDDLEKCMKAELKADKFRVAVLLVLEEKRQTESKAVLAESVAQDVRYLHAAMEKKDGGETLMLQICVTRSDIQLREVLRAYEKTYGRNFAKEMLKRSTNLVGEVLAHILNGVINKPMRDAQLLRHAIKEYTVSGAKNRDELLISRVVRYHWDRYHFEKIKYEYKRKYGTDAYVDIAASLKGDYKDYMVELVR